MDLLILIISVSFIAGVLSCHFFWRWYQSSDVKQKVSELEKAKVAEKFNMGGGVTYYRPYRLGKGQEGSDGKLSGLSEISLIEHNEYVEMFGSWNKNSKNQIDPFSFYLPTGSDVVTPDRLIEFGQYFVNLGNKKNKEFEMYN